ncbi:PAS domain-containing sensor histidine kinase [Ramlibacter aurantiacus]|uniref:PAS domain-containing sensor histidine kinase n=1 Tax=Ramlibacter aurantiacus TaxID=2801330 RepID=UPI00339006A5
MAIPLLNEADAAGRLAALLDSAMDAIISVDEQQRIVLYNRAAQQTFGWPAEQVLGRPMEMLMPERFRRSHAGHVRHFAETNVTSRRKGEGMVLYGLRADGCEFPMDASISQMDTAEGKVFSVIVRDVTERVKARQDLARFATEASAIREQEKTRVARELHDELAQSLTALKMDAMWVREQIGARPQDAADKLAHMLEMLDDCVAATRRISADLRPLVLDDLGLVPAIEWLVQNFVQRWGVACELDIDESLELPEPYATAVFRIVQESLVNVAKHAGASRAWVRIAREGREIVLSVRDDGRGFVTEAPRKPQSIGLIGLRERATLLRGTVSIASTPGQGTRVEARIPAEPGEGAA